MHDDIRVTLRTRGFIRQPDGSYSKADSLAPRPSHPVVKHDARPALEPSPPDEAGSGPRLVLRFTRFAVSLLDFDNGAGGCKFLCDALRYEKLIPDDDPGSVDFQFRQVKVSTFAEEGTMIEIEPGDSGRGKLFADNQDQPFNFASMGPRPPSCAPRQDQA